MHSDSILSHTAARRRALGAPCDEFEATDLRRLPVGRNPERLHQPRACEFDVWQVDVGFGRAFPLT